MEDRWVWDMNGEGVFRVKDLRNLLDESFLPKDSTATRWVKSILIKINVFAWKVYLDRLPTRLNLIRRGVQSPLGSYSEWLSWFNSIRVYDINDGYLEALAKKEAELHDLTSSHQPFTILSVFGDCPCDPRLFNMLSYNNASSIARTGDHQWHLIALHERMNDMQMMLQACIRESTMGVKRFGEST
nr:RNA-directed DNA polymerase, eukaryota [Tanacetum cinerariifolium]